MVQKIVIFKKVNWFSKMDILGIVYFSIPEGKVGKDVFLTGLVTTCFFSKSIKA